MSVDEYRAETKNKQGTEHKGDHTVSFEDYYDHKHFVPKNYAMLGIDGDGKFTFIAEFEIPSTRRHWWAEGQESEDVDASYSFSCHGHYEDGATELTFKLEQCTIAYGTTMGGTGGTAAYGKQKLEGTIQFPDGLFYATGGP